MIRARPLLGTRVDVRVDHPDDEAANAAIDRAFAAVAEVHRLMSFHEVTSDVSRLNRDAAREAVAVNPLTFDVLHRAREFSEMSGGAFDVSIGAALVEWGFLPAPPGAPAPDQRASWRDIVLERDTRVRFARPLWIDLGGIAKGFAVDRAIGAMQLAPDIQAIVNAGGDLRVVGPRAESIHLRSALAMQDIPVIEIEQGALASSSGREHLKQVGAAAVAPYIDRHRGGSMGLDSFVSVAAEDCLTADALTKVVLALDAAAEPILGHFGAIAYFYAPGKGWASIGSPEPSAGASRT